MEAYILSAFTRTIEGGNPAGVVLEADTLVDKDMQAIAAWLGFSETAFVFRSESADCKVRFFTPTTEVELCGHATVATFFLLHHLGRLGPGEYRQETLAGILPVAVLDDGEIYMDQNLPIFGDTVETAVVAGVLGIGPEQLLPGKPAQLVSTGLADIMVPLRDRAALAALRPDMPAIAELSQRLGCTGLHVFAIGEPETAECRNFAPGCGIPEEAATGTANGAMACYLVRHGLVRDATPLVISQGRSINRPSEIRVRLQQTGDVISRVQVGGWAIVTGRCALPY